jgi:hypothetical protein
MAGDIMPELRVKTLTPDESDPRWLDDIGQVTGVGYGLDGDRMVCTLGASLLFFSSVLNPGRKVEVWRGDELEWCGRLLEPVPTRTGWQIQASHGW